MDLRWDIFGTLSTREQAALLLIALVVLSFIVVPGLRRSLHGAFRPLMAAAFAPQILFVFGVLAIWCCGWVYLAYELGVWQVSQAKDTLVILVGFGFPFLMWAVTKAGSGVAIARHTFTKVIGGVALVVYVIGLWPFPLWAELVSQAFAAFLVMLRAVAQRQDNGRAVVRLCSFFLMALGAASILWAVVHGVEALPRLDPLAVGRDFALTLRLPLVCIPYVYFVAYYAACEQIAVRKRAMTGRRVRLRVWLALLLGFRARYGSARQFYAERTRLPPARTFRGTVALIKERRSTNSGARGLGS